MRKYAIGADINNPGASTQARTVNNVPVPLKNALVLNVVVNEDHPEYKNGASVGDALVKIIGDGGNEYENSFDWASPLDTSYIEYPLPYELVSVQYIGGKLRYSKRIDMTRQVSSGVSARLVARYGQQPTSETNSEDIMLASMGVTDYTTSTIDSQLRDSDLFSNINVMPLRVCEGDIVIQGRFGNTIRLGSSLFSDEETNPPKPNILITTGHWQTPDEVSTTATVGGVTPYSSTYESINNDKSSIWMVTDEVVDFKSATGGRVRSTAITRGKNYYSGAQIFINSDRVVLNSKLDEVQLFANTEINLSAVESITIDADKDTSITAQNDIFLDAVNDIFITGNTISVDTKSDMSYRTSGNYSILANKIFIGTTNSQVQPMVLGGELIEVLSTVIDSLLKIITSYTPLPSAATNIALLTADLVKLKLVLPVINSRTIFVSE
jgi:hypothetical protein